MANCRGRHWPPCNPTGVSPYSPDHHRPGSFFRFCISRLSVLARTEAHGIEDRNFILLRSLLYPQITRIALSPGSSRKICWVNERHSRGAVTLPGRNPAGSCSPSSPAAQRVGSPCSYPSPREPLSKCFSLLCRHSECQRPLLSLCGGHHSDASPSRGPGC